MRETEIMPWIAGIVAVVFVLYISLVERHAPKKMWILPGGLSLLFFLISLRAAFVEGPLQFWTEHTRNLWGNQIWFDLLLGVSAAIALAIPRAKKMRMSILLWVVFCLALGSIGLYAFLSRLLYLESRDKS